MATKKKRLIKAEGQQILEEDVPATNKHKED